MRERFICYKIFNTMVKSLTLSKWLLPILAVTAAVLVYLPALNSPFVYDDGHAIYQNPAVLSGASFSKIFSDPSLFSARRNARMYRPLTLLSYSLNYRIAGFKMPFWHGVHLFFHGLNVLLIFLIVRKITANSVGSFVSAFIFAVHPLCSETVIYQSARSSLLATTAVLGAFYFHVEEKNISKILVATLIFALGLLTKETAIVFPVLTFLYDFTLNKKNKPRWKVYFLYGAVVIGYLMLRSFLFEVETFHVSKPVRPVWENLLNQAGITLFYLEKFFYPVHLSIEHNLQATQGWLPQGVALWRVPLLSVPLVVGLLLSVLVFRKRFPFWSFGLGWWFVALAPESSIIPLVQLANERRAYLPMVGACLIVSLSLVNKGNKGKLFTIILIPCMFILLTFHRAKEWHSAETLWASAYRREPNCAVALHGVASARLDKKDLANAEKNYKLLINNFPTYYKGYLGLGRVFIAKGEYESAQEALEKSLSIFPFDEMIWTNLSDVYLKTNRIEQAEMAARRAIEMNPEAIQAWNNLAVALARSGRPAEGLVAIEQALQLNPRYAVGHFNKGNILKLLRRQGDAIASYRRALEIDPNFNLAREALSRETH